MLRPRARGRKEDFDALAHAQETLVIDVGGEGQVVHAFDGFHHGLHLAVTGVVFHPVRPEPVLERRLRIPLQHARQTVDDGLDEVAGRHGVSPELPVVRVPRPVQVDSARDQRVRGEGRVLHLLHLVHEAVHGPLVGLQFGRVVVEHAPHGVRTIKVLTEQVARGKDDVHLVRPHGGHVLGVEPRDQVLARPVANPGGVEQILGERRRLHFGR
ncbi:ORF196 [Saltwater crocodilepox virus]|nr:ORF196 [Saltwater crocodilepox virus]QGT48989.1 ORF196 [Saltwater crocodilepox virus]QGT49203.1 ORF196 [Saltwater crocodilepox virus]